MITYSRNAQQAREAYLQGDVELAQKAHQISLNTTLEASGNTQLLGDNTSTVTNHENEMHSNAGGYIKSAVFGGLDGIITTFAVVAVAAASNMRISVVLAYGIANLIGDGLSMALGDYLSTKSEQEYQKRERKILNEKIDTQPEAQKLQLQLLYETKGLTKTDAQQIVELISNHREAWMDIVTVEQLGLLPEDEDPIKNGVVTFVSFALFGLIPLLPYVYAHVISYSGSPSESRSLLTVSVVFTAVSLFMLGLSKSKYSCAPWWRCAVETLLVGSLASACAFFVGKLFSLYLCSDYVQGTDSKGYKSFELRQLCS